MTGFLSSSRSMLSGAPEVISRARCAASSTSSNRFGTFTTQSSTVTRAILRSFSLRNELIYGSRGDAATTTQRETGQICRVSAGCASPTGARRLVPPLGARLYYAHPQRFRRAGWQSGYAEDCKSSYSGSIPLPASTYFCRRFLRLKTDVAQHASKTALRRAAIKDYRFPHIPSF